MVLTIKRVCVVLLVWWLGFVNWIRRNRAVGRSLKKVKEGRGASNSLFEGKCFVQMAIKVCPYSPPLHCTALCVQMVFTRTFETTTKCNNLNHVWSNFYKILVVLKCNRWANIFDTDISRCINTYIKVVYLAFLGYYLCSYK